MEENQITMFISGDFCPAYLTVEGALDDKATVYGVFFETINNSDISITNLECPLTCSDQPIQKIGPNLKASPIFAKYLKESGFDLVTLANNHIYDYGQQGLCDTFESLDQASVSHVGAGRSLKEARKIYYTTVKGEKVAIVNFAEIEFCSADHRQGGAYPLNVIENTYQIQEAKNNADYVIVIIHGGHEHYHYPSPETLKRYRFFAENGASAIFAHHTHCIGGYENWKGVPIFYSLGNFIFPMNHKMPNMWHVGYAVLLKLSSGTVSYSVMPYEQCRNNILSIDGKINDEIYREIQKINSVITDPIQLLEKWDVFVQQNDVYLALVSGFGKYKIGILRRLGVQNFFLKRKQLEMILQVTRCEAHRELTHDVLAYNLKCNQK